ncbi:MAG: DUF2793 domain-containing protein [Sphingomonadaceae bacterium]|nr:DUF2793 domain-containing protein [Sphingomonadaceae bacterium]
MTTTTRYGLPQLQAGQAQKEITHNEAVGRIDALLHLVVESRHSAVPALATGTAWIVAPSAPGAFADQVGQIAVCDNNGWSTIAPRDGCIAFVRDEAVFIHFAAGMWRDGWTVSSLSIGGRTLLGGPNVGVVPPSGGSVIDSEARGAIAQLLTALRGLGLVDAA